MGMCVRVKRGLVVAGLLLGLVFCGLWTGAAVAAPPDAGPTVSSIVVQGNRRIDTDTVRSYFKAAPGERLTPAEIDAGLKALYATGLFQDVRVSQAGGKLVVTVVEAPVINKIAFEGNFRIKDEQLTEEIQSKERGSLSRAKVQADTQRIIEVYQRNGRFDVKVVPEIIDRPNDRVDLIFQITEGEKTGIKHIIFIGNHAFRDYRLKQVIKTAESNWLSFLQTTDVYDPDRIEADRDLIRRFYLKHGYADVQVVSATGEYDPAQKGFIVTFTIEEGPLYHFGKIDIQSNVRAIDAQSLHDDLDMSSGQIYNGEAIEKTVEDMTISLARRGYPFGTVRPRGDRNATTRTIGVSFVVDEGQRAYIERINIRGNYRTRDYVIRRELDINEGDPYNRALVDRAERRIKNLNFFKSVKITDEPGSAPDRVVINIDVEEQPTGDFSVMGGYSTAEGWLAEVSVQERNLLGTGRFARAAATYGEYIRSVQLSYAEPYFLDTRSSMGIDLFAKETLASSYISYGTEAYGGTLKWGLPIREDLGFQLRYSAYTQKITLPSYLDDCNNIDPDLTHTFPTPSAIQPPTGTAPFPSPYPSGTTSCYTDSQASLPVRVELADGSYLTSSFGYGLTYNTLDNNKNPTNGVYVAFGQDFAGAGGDASYMRSTFEARSYYEVVTDLVGILHLQAGDMIGFSDCPKQSGINECTSNGDYVRMLDDFKMGPNLVRGFQPAGIGPRDITPGTTNDNLGGTMYWGASLEFQYPFYFLPKDSGFRGAVFVDSGSVWGYKGESQDPATGEINGTVTPAPPATPFVCQCAMKYADDSSVRMSAGASIIWDSPFGPLRFDFAYPFLRKSYDRTQFFAFGGGAQF